MVEAVDGDKESEQYGKEVKTCQAVVVEEAAQVVCLEYVVGDQASPDKEVGQHGDQVVAEIRGRENNQVDEGFSVYHATSLFY